MPCLWQRDKPLPADLSSLDSWHERSCFPHFWLPPRRLLGMWSSFRFCLSVLGRGTTSGRRPLEISPGSECLRRALYLPHAALWCLPMSPRHRTRQHVLAQTWDGPAPFPLPGCGWCQLLLLITHSPNLSRPFSAPMSPRSVHPFPTSTPLASQSCLVSPYHLALTC